VVGIGRGWGVAAEHFAERFGLIVLIALGESIIAIGFGAGSDLDAGVLLSVMLGVIVVSALGGSISTLRRSSRVGRSWR
jgi:low temperature requirement protein LtrA